MEHTTKNKDSISHVRGTSIFVDDISEIRGTLQGLVFDSPVAHAHITSLDISDAERCTGVVKILTYNDIRGENQIGGIIQDEPLFAEKEIHFQGQAIALILAETLAEAKKAQKLIQLTYTELPVVTSVRQAHKNGRFTNASRTFRKNDAEKIFAKCDYVFEGQVFTNGQEHLYLETQGAYSVPLENGNIKIYSSTQGPTSVQKATAKVLGVPMHRLEVEVNRLGGGFGGKEDQATAWAAMAAVGTQITGRPVKLILDRHSDMRMTGKRHPYESDFKIGLDKNLKIKAYTATFYQNAGAAADLSPAVAERTLFHATNSYNIENVEVTVHSCKTNLPPNTAFRGFGGPQGMFVIEAAISKAAEALGVSAHKIQELNLLKDGDEFPYGQIASETLIQDTWNKAFTTFDIEKNIQQVADFNSKSKYFKKGYALMPITFGISFTNTPMNHARALVHIYQDGSVGISTGAVEMGQSVNTKMVLVATLTLGISPEKIKIETTNTTRVANTSPTAASATADLNGKAVEMACKILSNRLKTESARLLHLTDIKQISIKDNQVFVSEKLVEISWEELVLSAHLQRLSLTENAHYSTPEIHFDKSKEKGHPFAYHVYGTAFTVVSIDCIKGIYEIDSVKIVHDFGKSLSPALDFGQVEGALVQGIGWMTMEELLYNEKGRLLSNSLSGYKVPDIFSVPKIIEILPLETVGHKHAILKSKAVGEPPLMYGIGTYFALENAIKQFNPNYKHKFNSPLTPEKLLNALYDNHPNEF